MDQYLTAPWLSPSNPALAPLPVLDRRKFCAFGAGPASRPHFRTILDAIHDVIASHPHRKAATPVLPDGSLDEERSITYERLGRHADLLADKLQAFGVTNGDRICIFLKRSESMLTAIVATLKIGACYVPQHVGTVPPEQLLHVAEATRTKVVLTLLQYLPTIPDFGTAVSVIAVDDPRLYERTAAPISPYTGTDRQILPSDFCYIIFTSGTTGKPKGVQVTHGNVANVILTEPMSLGLRPGARIAQLLSISFDMGAWEILGSLTHACELLIRSRDILAAAQYAQIIIATPSVLSTIRPEQTPLIETIAVAGEPCPKYLALEWSCKCRFFNACGPTEVTIINTSKLVDPEELGVLTIGSPTPNNTVYVFKPETTEPCAIGEVGEMWAGGACVSRGYLENEKLTKERYVPDPFVANEGEWRMYRTGDLARWNERGELEHFGRIDEQVKVKGFRVELDGVSAIIENLGDVKKAVVLKYDDELVAFVSPWVVDRQDVQKIVGSELPYYCVPSRVFMLEYFPKTGNGKTDKRMLLKMIEPETELFSTSTPQSAAVATGKSNIFTQRVKTLFPFPKRA